MKITHDVPVYAVPGVDEPAPPIGDPPDDDWVDDDEDDEDDDEDEDDEEVACTRRWSTPASPGSAMTPS
jgi:hypothetical protein